MTFDGVDLYPTVVEKAAVLLRGVIAANSFLDGNKRTARIAVMRAGRMITQAHGNLLEADVDALVNTVNTVGIMGKGIALQFKRAYPEMFKSYARAAKSHDVQMGRMHVWPTGAMTGPRFIINFPTKGHWRSRSQIADIERGLDDLVRLIRDQGIRSIAIPPLGCGNGGLDWATVEPLIRRKLQSVADVDVWLYAPEGAPAAADMPNALSKPAITSGRAALIEVMAQYARRAMGAASEFVKVSEASGSYAAG